jgi:hypothetical protein
VETPLHGNVQQEEHTMQQRGKILRDTRTGPGLALE